MTKFIAAFLYVRMVEWCEIVCLGYCISFKTWRITGKIIRTAVLV